MHVAPSLIMTHRLSRVCLGQLKKQRHSNNYGDICIAVTAWTCRLRTFGSDSKGSGEDDCGVESPEQVPFSNRTSVFGRRRPLSPLERISQLLPQESLAKIVWELRGDKPCVNEEGLKEQTPKESEITMEDSDMKGSMYERNVKAQEQNITQQEKPWETEGTHTPSSPPTLLPRERVISFGEVLLAEYRRKRRTEFQKMFQLQEGVKLHSSWGVIPHQAIEGCPTGTVLRTSLGLPILIRRPSLEEFTLFMKRGPAIAYPKDATAMLMMMDVNEGDCVLESGSGSGAMSLFLSRAVGSKGSVLSVEVREDHHRRSVLNYQRWRSAWTLRSGEVWPDNVHFHHCDLTDSASLLAGRSFNSVALDMVSPHLALPAVVPHLHRGAVCAIYLANITQIVDLMEGLRCSTLPLACERITEVQWRDWLLAPSIQKDGSFNQRKPFCEESTKEESNGEEKEQHKSAPFGSVPYIARPHPEQTGHTAFLVKLRKVYK